MKSVALIAILVAVVGVCAVAAQPQQPTQSANAATVAIQFDNSKKYVVDGKKALPVRDALAEKVFFVKPEQVKLVTALDQSGYFTSQSVVNYKAVGPTTNGKSVYDNCVANTKVGFFTNSAAYNAVKKATDTWWPGDKVKIEKATCSKAKR